MTTQEQIERSGRPLWVKLYSVILLLTALIMVFIILQLVEMMGIVSGVTMQVFAAAAIGILAIITIIGLWRLKRWGLILAVIGCLLQIAFAVSSIINGGIGRDYLLIICFAAVLALCWRDRKIFA